MGENQDSLIWHTPKPPADVQAAKPGFGTNRGYPLRLRLSQEETREKAAGVSTPTSPGNREAKFTLNLSTVTLLTVKNADRDMRGPTAVTTRVAPQRLCRPVPRRRPRERGNRGAQKFAGERGGRRRAVYVARRARIRRR